MSEEQDKTVKVRATLKRLSANIQDDRLTIGYSYEARDPSGAKKWCMVSRTVDMRDQNYTQAEAKVISCLLAKRVTSEVLRDVVAHGVLSQSEAKAEVTQAFVRYDRDIARFLDKEDD